MFLLKKYLKFCNSAEKILNCISFASIGMGFAFIITLLFWYSYPYKPLVINHQPFHISTREVKQGGLLIYEIDYCKNTDTVSTVSRSFVNGLLFTMPIVEGSNKRGCGVNNVFLQLPPDLPAGDYVLEINYTYRMNPIKDVSVKVSSEHFTVVE